MQKYLITSREFYTDTPAIFRNILHEQFARHRPTYALYRDKSNPNYDIQAAHFVEVCNQFETIKSFIHRDAELAKKLEATGVHLTSTQFDEITIAKELGLEVIISTHTHDEVIKAKKLGADAVTYSPVFASPGKGEPKGIKDLKDILNKCEIKVFALGGIVDSEQVKAIEETEAYGFASIRYFY
ncbi:Thiamine-phosphate pyrophosphorylase [Sulfurimonas gotlandica GD1]|jgi:thiamine-phosphate pyrophosphorylase|uniref:Thiamine-phosphate pyrophosphorylase n=1 Tax=Sulfurimonas gotlandica (strain DSM 19862 / JCM 16533 / GD1) TaxID=929558 RepID=B6BNB5_SULGG|nr:thiamine phosphate synthase [Sulfurimonas gotlandica]EDZ61396.1 thiamine monophosphate synthase [Sulfurimonas gotlandica GD1]EHP30985.1 Thiamine-phosphate pyrophosphorylase [Sulfurimonas gotlandica GD1]